MIAAIAPSDARREKMLFTQPYGRSAFALITAKGDQSIHLLSDLRGKRLAVIKQAVLTDYIRSRYPKINVVEFDNDEDLLNSVTDGRAEAAIALLMTAEYQLNSEYRDRLKVANTVDAYTAYIAFAIGKNDPELQTILDKVLITIPPYELDMIANRWRPNNMVVAADNSIWGRHRNAIIAGAVIAGLLLLFALARTFWLRRQMMLEARARRQLATQVHLLERLVDSMPFPITIRDRDGNLTYCNMLALNIIEQPYEAVKGKPLSVAARRLPAEQVSYLDKKMREVMDSDTAWQEDISLQFGPSGPEQNDSKALTASMWLLPWHDAAGEVVGTVMALWDISDREQLVQQLSEASERAEASNRAKSTFLSTMSHEIRTPMNAIIGMLDMAIKKGQQGELDLQALQVAWESAQGLVGLIGDILDLSRIEGGALDFNPERINLGALINQLLVIFNGMAIDKNIMLHKHYPDALLPDVVGDPLRIKQVLSNLLSNAIKFTDRGSVTLTLQQVIQPQLGSVRYIIEIQDSGVGINEAQLATLFKPFTQADNRRAGTGLGLYISRTLCESMDGTLTLSSVLNEGSCARAELVLPLATVDNIAPARTAHAPQPQSTPLQVLVVDDNAANRILLAKQLAWLGHHAHVAETAHEAFALWDKGRFDVLITDCNMPEMNGYQLTEKIRQAEQADNKPPVWILGFTANAMHEVTERCLAAGMNSCLFKPCTINSLAVALDEMALAERNPDSGESEE